MGELKTGDLCSRLWTCFRSVKEMEKEARNQKKQMGIRATTYTPESPSRQSYDRERISSTD
jgi:hypothetical protein